MEAKAIVAVLLIAALSGSAQASSVSLERKEINWNYSIRNDSQRDERIDQVFIPLSGPIEGASVPEGWGFDTDYRTFLLIYNAAPRPYPYDVGPGGALDVRITSRCLETKEETAKVSFWDHAKGVSGDIEEIAVSVPKALYGDINNDRKVSVLDAQIALSLAVGKTQATPYQIGVGDILPYPGEDRPFGDGRITVSDAIWILDKAVGKPLPPEL